MQNKLYIDGRFVDAGAGGTIDVLNPHDGTLITAIAAAEAEDVDRAVPTMQQAGVAGYDATFREMLFAPKGTPAAIVQRMNEEVARALARPEVRQKLQGNDLDPRPETPDVTARQLLDDTAKWTGVIRKINLKVD